LPDLGGRFCSDECCLPCPLTELIYSDSKCADMVVYEQANVFQSDFPTHELVAGWLSVVSLIASVFLLLTFAVLAPEKSHRHYLSVGLTIANVILQVGA